MQKIPSEVNSVINHMAAELTLISLLKHINPKILKIY